MTKKTTSALAIAALVASGAASAATIQIDENTSVSVGFNAFATYASVDNDAGEAKTDFFDNGSGFVLSGEHTANELTTFVNIDIDTFGLETGDNPVLDELNAGVSGGFGTFTIGTDAAIYDSYVDSIMDGDETANVYSVSPGDKDRIVRYDSNDMNGLNFSIEAQIAGDGNAQAGDDIFVNSAGNETFDNADFTTSGAGKTGASAAVAASYDLGTAALHAGYDMRDVTVGHEIYGFGATTSIMGVNLGVSYQEDKDPNAEATLLGLSAGYNYGAGSVYGRVGYTDFASTVSADQISLALGGETETQISATAGKTDETATTETVLVDSNLEDSDTFTQYLLGANFNVTDSAYVYAEYLSLDRVNGEGDSVSAGTVIFF